MCIAIALWFSGNCNPAAAQQSSMIQITNNSGSGGGAFVRGVSNDGSRIVFESTNDYTGENTDHNNEIFVYDSTLRKIVQITKTGNQSTSGSDGGSTVNNTNCPGGCEPENFVPTNTVPAISGDGTRIAFVSSSGLLTDTGNPDGNMEIYLATLPVGSTVATFQRITETTGSKATGVFDNNRPTINYDGSVIAFASTRRYFNSGGAQIFTAQNEDNLAQLYVYQVASHSFAQVTYKRISEGTAGFEVKGQNGFPFLSGNGRILAFNSSFNFGGSNTDLNNEIYLYRIGDPTNQVTQVTNTTDYADVPTDGSINVLGASSKHLSDDGSWLVFESAGGVTPTKTGGKVRDVFLYNLNTGAFTQITTQNAGNRALSDYNYFPSLNGAGTFVTFSSKLNLPVVNDSAGNFNNSREVYRYEIAGSNLYLTTQTGISTSPSDQRLVIISPFISDDGRAVSFTNKGNLIATQFSANSEVFQALLRPVVRETGRQPVLANSASYSTTAIARGSSVSAFGLELANAAAASGEFDNYPFELNGVSVTIGDTLSGIAARISYVSPTQINFVFPEGISAADEISFIINNNGVISRGIVDVRDGAPGIFSAAYSGSGQALAQCSITASDGTETQYTSMPCPIGYDRALNSLILYGTGWRFGSDIRVRLTFDIGNGEQDTLEIPPGSAGKYVDPDGKEHLGVDQIIITLDDDLVNKVNVDTHVLLTSNSESVTSQDGITTSFSLFLEDLAVVNGASQENGAIARGSIAVASPQNDDDEDDTFTTETITASSFDPPLVLGGISVKVAGLPARILAVSPYQVKFVLPETLEPSGNVLVELTNGVKIFNTRVTVQDAAPGLFTVTDDGAGDAVAKCGQILASGSIVYTAPPCAVSNGSDLRTLVLSGTGWRFASGVKVSFGSTELTPSYAGAEPGLPGMDRIEIPLTSDLAEEIAGREREIVVNATINSQTANSQTGVTVAFKSSVEDTDSSQTSSAQSNSGQSNSAQSNSAQPNSAQSGAMTSGSTPSSSGRIIDLPSGAASSSSTRTEITTPEPESTESGSTPVESVPVSSTLPASTQADSSDRKERRSKPARAAKRSRKRD
ncbi:MAG TPA: hypothetical protein VJ302_17565 [Blastocatellia bacterium]|nr:hypothetical protein [Blastocatellia bacterium]